ncbi:MAG: beta-lactamase family protein [Proteobacteria bacterium]|nr:beta-lactamase family protein [Pseudomonadota bacterium]
MTRSSIAVAFAVILAAVGTGAVAQPAMPPAAPAAAPVAETAASDIARRMLAAARAGDDAFIAFSRDANARPFPDDALRTMRGQLAGLQVHALISATPTHAEFTVFDPQLESWGVLGLNVTAEEPHKINGLTMQPGRHPPDVADTPRLQPAALVAAVRQRLEAAAKADRFSGAVLIAENGKTLLDAAYGLADREAKAPNTTDTQFRFGSMGKMFTAVSIMQLAQAGKLDLTAPIGRYLPGYPNRDIANHVTVDNLLTHTGGTGDIFGPQFEAHRLELKTPQDYVALYGARAPLFAPGARNQYSNYGFMLLGRIVETVSGQSYDDYIAGHIFKPAGMTATGNQPETVRLPKRVTGYMTRKGQIVSAAETLPWSGTPAGGGYSTVGDLAKFADALMADRLLDAAHTRLLTDGGFTGADGKFWRYDFGAPAGDGRRYYGHNGGAPGMNGELRIFPASPPKNGDKGHPAATIVVLANRDPPAATGVANFITDRLP